MPLIRTPCVYTAESAKAARPPRRLFRLLTPTLFGNLPPLKWLGSRSFSLYLVHEPVVVSVATTLGTSNPIAVLLISLPLALAVAEGFFRLVESASPRLAIKVGNAVAEWLSRRVPVP